MSQQGKTITNHPGVSLREIAQTHGSYPLEAYEFVQAGLAFTAGRVHGAGAAKTVKPRHVSGAQLAAGLRDYALANWGLLARTVLAKWGIRSTTDFGRIVFNMVDAGFLRKQPEDALDDFRDVYDFERDFETGYRMSSKL
jgi:uncharacterized repeat protein (TIGR04138 family)